MIVSIVSVVAMKNLHLDQVEEESHDSGNEHDVFINFLWVSHSLGGLEAQPDGDGEQERDAHQSSHDFGSGPSVGVFALRRLSSDSQ